MTETDVVIVGAGPIGLELAVCLKHQGVDYVQLEAGALAHTVTWYPKQTRYFSSPQRIAIAGVPLVTPNNEKATREEYLAYLRAVVQQFGLKVNCYEKVKQATQTDAGFTLTTNRETYRTKNVVLAIGDMHRPRRLGVPGEDLPHVSHYFDEPHHYFRQRVVVVGGKNSAVEAALRCHHAGADVTISYRGERFSPDSIKYWLLPEIEALIKHGQIRFIPNSQVTAITDEQVCLSVGDKTIDHPADFVLLLTGYEQDPTLFDQLGVGRHGENMAPAFEAETMMTNVPGVYVVGTAAAGTQQHFKLFIENCHPHVTRIVRHLTGTAPPPGLVNAAAETFGLEES